MCARQDFPDFTGNRPCNFCMAETGMDTSSQMAVDAPSASGRTRSISEVLSQGEVAELRTRLNEEHSQLVEMQTALIAAQQRVIAIQDENRQLRSELETMRDRVRACERAGGTAVGRALCETSARTMCGMLCFVPRQQLISVGREFDLRDFVRNALERANLIRLERTDEALERFYEEFRGLDDIDGLASNERQAFIYLGVAWRKFRGTLEADIRTEQSKLEHQGDRKKSYLLSKFHWVQSRVHNRDAPTELDESKVALDVIESQGACLWDKLCEDVHGAQYLFDDGHIVLPFVDGISYTTVSVAILKWIIETQGFRAVPYEAGRRDTI